MGFNRKLPLGMQLINILQINFFKDHTKIILCPLMGAVTYIDDQRNHRTFTFDLIEKHGKKFQYLHIVNNERRLSI